MTVSSAYIGLFIGGKSRGEMSGGKMSGYHRPSSAKAEGKGAVQEINIYID